MSTGYYVGNKHKIRYRESSIECRQHLDTRDRIERTQKERRERYIRKNDRFVDNGARGKSCKKGNRAQKSKHQMRTSLGMTWNWNS